MKKLLVRYSIAIAIAGALTIAFLALQGFDEANSTEMRLRLLADAFTIPGVIFMLVAGLVWVASDGFFDGLTYGLRWCARTLIPFTRIPDEKYYDYKMRKKEKRARGYSFIFFTGLGFFVVAIVFIVLFYLV